MESTVCFCRRKPVVFDHHIMRYSISNCDIEIGALLDQFAGDLPSLLIWYLAAASKALFKI